MGAPNTPSGAPFAANPVVAPYPSGDITGVTDSANIAAAIARAVAAKKYLLIRNNGSNYIVKDIVLASNLYIKFEPNTVLMLPNRTIATTTWTSGNAVVAVTSAAGLFQGMQVSDPSMDLTVNNPFGGIQFGTIISNIVGLNVTLSLAPTTSGAAAALHFHPSSNVFVGTDVTNFSLTCDGGLAYFDGNASEMYPYSVNTNDGLNNGLRLVNPSQFTINGICGRNAFYHGAIMVGEITRPNIPYWRGQDNGYRSIHLHSEQHGANTTPDNKDVHFGLIESVGNGRKSFYFCGPGNTSTGNTNFQTNCLSGVFAIFSNAKNYQFDDVRSKDDRGFAFHMSGGGGAFLPNFASKHNQVSNLSAENCGSGLQLDGSLESASFGNIDVQGIKKTIAGCNYVDSANTTVYYCTPSGTTSSYQARAIDLPAGSIVANGIHEGMRVGAGSSTPGSVAFGPIIWTFTIGGGVAGADRLMVINGENPASSPYSTASNGESCIIWGCRDVGINTFSGAATVVRDIKIANVNLENPGRFGFQSYTATGAIRLKDLYIGAMTITGAISNAMQMGSAQDVMIDKLSWRNCGSIRDSGTISAGYHCVFQDVVSMTINQISSEHDGAFTNNFGLMSFDANSGNIKAAILSGKKPGSGLGVLVSRATGAAATANGVAGPVTLVNPTASDGTALTVGSGTSQISIVDSTACIITRPGPAAVPAAKTANYTYLVEDDTILFDCTSGALTATLPAASTCPGKEYTAKKIDASANALTGITADGVAVSLSSQWSSITVKSNGAVWYIKAKV